MSAKKISYEVEGTKHKSWKDAAVTVVERGPEGTYYLNFTVTAEKEE